MNVPNVRKFWNRVFACAILVTLLGGYAIPFDRHSNTASCGK